MAILTWTPSPTPTAVLMAVRASWDTQQRPSYNPNAPRRLKPNPNLKPSPPVTLATRTDPSVFDILKRPTQEVKPVKVDLDDSYLGYERWLPTPPKVEKPRSVFNAATLAYIGDCIYELYARRHFLFPPLSIEEYNDRVTSVVRCEAQDALLQELLNDSFLSNVERLVEMFFILLSFFSRYQCLYVYTRPQNNPASLKNFVFGLWHFKLGSSCSISTALKTTENKRTALVLITD
ncbi:hypothetical protein DITRI_Ditri19aG0092300 [Diplodiscus trichospermus]